jgi:hypothetical protein
MTVCGVSILDGIQEDRLFVCALYVLEDAVGIVDDADLGGECGGIRIRFVS